WMSVHSRFHGAIEITTEPQEFADLDSSNIGKEAQRYCLIFVAVVYVLSFVFLAMFYSFLSLILIGPMILIIVWWVHYRKEERLALIERRRSQRFNRFICSFSHIDTLVLDSLRDNYSYSVFDATISTFGQLHIERLTVRELKCGQGIQKRLIELARKHRIQHIFVIVETCTIDRLRLFFLALAKMGTAVNIYEDCLRADANGHDLCFHRPQSFWNAMRSSLEREGVRMTVSTQGDPQFNIR
ncbi:hypothetical protein PMAYCL1PPCAC_06325, partial [Pristionchus mayeri]